MCLISNLFQNNIPTMHHKDHQAKGAARAPIQDVLHTVLPPPPAPFTDLRHPVSMQFNIHLTTRSDALNRSSDVSPHAGSGQVAVSWFSSLRHLLRLHFAQCHSLPKSTAQYRHHCGVQPFR